MNRRTHFHGLLAPDTCKFNFVSWGVERWQQAVHLLLSYKAVNGLGTMATSEQFMPAQDWPLIYHHICLWTDIREIQ